MSKSIHIVDILKASTGNAPVMAQSKLAYDTAYNLSDFGDDELITKRAALELGTGGSGTIFVLAAIAAGTTIPFFIDVAAYTGASPSSDLITKATSYDPSSGAATGRLQRYYDMLIEDQDTNSDGTGDFTGWNVYGHDDGSGNFKEDTYIIIRA